MKVMLLFFEDGEEDIVLKVQNLIRSVTRIDYMEVPQFETQSTSSALEIRESCRWCGFSDWEGGVSTKVSCNETQRL